MNIKVKETGEMVELEIRDENNIDWVNDLIGNAGAMNDGQFEIEPEGDFYIAEKETVEWWQKYISDQYATDADAKKLADDLDIEESIIRDRIAANTGNDYNDHRSEAVFTMNEIREEYVQRNASLAAALLGKRGGTSTSPAKRAASRANGKLGGRPRKTK
jgi:hypothetical protein